MNIMAWFGGLRTSVLTTIRKLYLAPSSDRHSGTSADSREAYVAYPVRRARYALLWALCQGSIFYGTDVHTWVQKFKVDWKLSTNIRTIFNPFYRLVEFWATHIYAGSIDPECGDGKIRPSAIPIETRNEALRPIIAQIFAASDWEQNKTVMCRLGTALGDVGLFAVDDVLNGRTYIEVIDPNNIVDYEDDGLGCCQRYTIEEYRPDPRPNAWTDAFGMPRQVIYREEGTLLYRDDKPVACHFATFLVDVSFHQPYPWDGQQEEWEEPYPFVPLILVPHAKQLPRIPFGQAEGMPALSKILECEDVASRFHDFIGKAVDPIWLLRGVQEPDETLDLIGGKNALPIIYGGDNATAQALLAALNLADVDGHIKLLREELQEDYPELRRDIENAAGDASGVALRVAQQRIETKAQSRRAGYDSALVSVVTYCMRIGSLRTYKGYEGLTESTDLSFRISDRPVFRAAKIDEMAVDEKFWLIAESAERSGVPIDAYLRLQGWSEERIKIVLDGQERAMAKGLPVGRAKQASPAGDAATVASQKPGATAP